MIDYTAFAFETVTVLSANGVTSLTNTTYNPHGMPAKAAIVTVGTGPLINYLYSTTATVSSTVGHTATPFTTIELEGNQQIRDFRTTSVSSATVATIKVSYFR